MSPQEAHEDGEKDGRGGLQKRSFTRKKLCRFCSEKSEALDYKNIQLLRHFITERGKIVPRRISGACAKHQRKIATAVKRARMIALMPFTMTGK